MVTNEKTLKISVDSPCTANSCEIRDAFIMIGGKWKSMILYVLSSQGVVRFNQLKKTVAGISQKMLTQQLRELERDGLIKRQVFPEVPPHVEYSMTELGLSLGPIYQAVHNWEQENLTEIYKCRRQYDAALT
ncbi:winged helix-turn-helix transcriptional regulator [Polynucleobacter rarus]|uniref:winged helix-turn-helix transcriptional regulator n=1 Tax=Polynucleobacter rarus TaxID=556055 RepID=UPI001FE6EC19|nr:helix-turn-helix domain-containing protein [Polynucleobacter rarus]